MIELIALILLFATIGLACALLLYMIFWICRDQLRKDCLANTERVKKNKEEWVDYWCDQLEKVETKCEKSFKGFTK